MWDEINTTTQQLIAIHIQHFAWNTQRTIWMDGRPHPPEFAEHTSMGFSTGEWVGNTLKVTTTHLKEGWLRRNGVARSDAATVTEHFIRHGNHLTWSVFVQDPKYLEEPFFRNRDYTYAETGSIGAYPCESVVEVMLPEEGYFPHYLPGENPFPDRVRAQSQDPVRSGDGRGGDDVPRVPQEDGSRAAATVGSRR